jgi:hypothetical protein
MKIVYYPKEHMDVHIMFAPIDSVKHIKYRLRDLFSPMPFSTEMFPNKWTVLALPYLLLEPHI